MLVACGPEAATPTANGDDPVAPTPTPGAPQPAVGGEIVHGAIGDPVVLNTVLATDEPSGWVTSRIYQGLVRANPEFQMDPYLAKSWVTSDDGLEIVFYLRDDVYWQDGEKFTAHDVKYTYDTIQHEDYTGPRRSDFRAIERTEVVSDYEVKLVLKEPDSVLLSRLGIGIMPEHIFGDWPVAELREHPANREPVGTGPYMLEVWEEGQYVVLTANPNYWGEGPYIPTVRQRMYQDSQVMLAALEAGEIDLMGIPHEDVDRVQAAHSDRLAFQQVPNNSYSYIGLKQDHPFFEDVRVRHALTYALNRQEMVDALFLGYGTLMNGPIAPVSWAYLEEGLNDYPFNPEKAKELLEAAGWTEGPDGVRVNEEGERMSFSVLTNSGNLVRENTLDIAQQQWAAIGVEMTPEPLEWSVLLDQYLDVAMFDAYLLGWSLGVDPCPFVYFHSSQGVVDGQLMGFNDVEYYNDEVDRLLEEARRIFDQDERKAMYDQIQIILNEELPYIFLYTTNSVTAIDKKIQGYVISPLTIHYPELWYIETQ